MAWERLKLAKFGTSWYGKWGKDLEFKRLENDFFVVICPTIAIRVQIEEGVWILDGCSFYICRWKAGFDPISHRIKKVQDWYIMPNLPLEYWDPRILEEIGNGVGTFLCAKERTNPEGSGTFVRLGIENNPN